MKTRAHIYHQTETNLNLLTNHFCVTSYQFHNGFGKGTQMSDDIRSHPKITCGDIST